MRDSILFPAVLYTAALYAGMVGFGLTNSDVAWAQDATISMPVALTPAGQAAAQAALQQFMQTASVDGSNARTVVPGTDAAAASPAAITLNHHIQIRGAVVKLGDIFSGPLAEPGKSIAYAPAPGEKVHLDSGWLADLARTNNVAWAPSGDSDDATVERAAVVLGDSDILAAITDSLVGQGMPAQSELDVAPGSIDRINAPASSQPVARVDDATWTSGHFTAALTIQAVGQPDQQMTVSGTVAPTLDVPVLARPVSQNDLIEAEDFTLVRKRVSEIAPGVVVEPQRLVGMTATRSLRPGETVQSRDIARPVLVPKGEAVTMILQTPYMTLTASGKALENGALGDTVRIENVRSNKILFGVVTEARTVIIRNDTAALN